MNNDRRKDIRALYEDAGTKAAPIECAINSLLKLRDAAVSATEAFKAAASSLKDDIEAIRDEEQEYRDNMPENMQSSERADAAENAIAELDNAAAALEDPDVEEFDGDTVVGHLSEAAGV